MGVDIVAFREVLDDVLEDGGVALGDHLVIAPLRADLLVGDHEDLEFRVREHGRADVAAVHDHATALGEGPEPLVHIVANEGDGRYGAHVGGNRQSADLRLHAAVAEVQFRGFVVVAEMEVETVDDGLQGLFVDGAVLRDHPVFHGVQGDAAVHRAAVQVQEIEFFRDHLGEGALTGGREAVNGDDDVRNVHNLYGFRFTNVEKKCDICTNVSSV